MDPFNVQHSTLGVFWTPNLARIPLQPPCADLWLYNQQAVSGHGCQPMIPIQTEEKLDCWPYKAREQVSKAIGIKEESNDLSSWEKAHPVSKQGLLQQEGLVVECLKHSTANHKVAGSSPTMTDFLYLLGVRSALLGVYWCLYRKVAWQNVPGLSLKQVEMNSFGTTYIRHFAYLVCQSGI